MKITKQQLKRIIKEEKAELLNELQGGRDDAFDILEELRAVGVSDTQLLEYILGNHLTSDLAFQVMSDFRDYELG